MFGLGGEVECVKAVAEPLHSKGRAGRLPPAACKRKAVPTKTQDFPNRCDEVKHRIGERAIDREGREL